MGIYIKGMKMPKDDETIRFVKLLNGKIVAVTSPTKEMGDIHEIIEVTEPHRRLIDESKIKTVYGEATTTRYQGYISITEKITHTDAPTIIEAEI